MVAVSIVYLVIAAVLIIVGIMASIRKLPGNSIIGLRLNEVRKSKETWDVAHAVAGPLWALAGVSLVFGGVVAWTAQGWMWLIPVVTAIVAVLALSAGGNLGARAALLHASQNNDEAGGCGEGGCNCGDGGCGSNEPAPEVNMDALREAARNADRG